jgi:hypothetical protein
MSCQTIKELCDSKKYFSCVAMVPQLDTHKSNHIKSRATAAPPTIDTSEEMRPLDFLTDYV